MPLSAHRESSEIWSTAASYLSSSYHSRGSSTPSRTLTSTFIIAPITSCRSKHNRTGSDSPFRCEQHSMVGGRPICHRPSITSHSLHRTSSHREWCSGMENTHQRSICQRHRIRAPNGPVRAKQLVSWRQAHQQRSRNGRAHDAVVAEVARHSPRMPQPCAQPTPSLEEAVL
jgi:hypothetical protein